MTCLYEGDHGDGKPFDGPGKSYAHASSSIGEVHFDDDESFSVDAKHAQYFVRPRTVTDFVWVAIHEVGHILGFNHVRNKNSVMFQTLNHNYVAGSDYLLDAQDVNMVQSNYGK